jgi:hypothetical protein|tara:strand:- start:511 stop:702 length:192 start_codon:yes stop_codon:yes gene_type:complete
MIDDRFSTYVEANKRADVIKLDGHWGCRFYVDNEVVKTEFYKGKSESWAEDCAENFVMGIKVL